jgi:hypothetical protein
VDLTKIHKAALSVTLEHQAIASMGRECAIGGDWEPSPALGACRA